MKRFLVLLGCLSLTIHLHAQEDDLLKTLEKDQPTEKQYTISTFKGTRLINGNTVEIPRKNTIEFRVGHRFGDIKEGEETFFGLDQAHMNILLDYSITDRLVVGYGRNSYQKLYEGLLKYKVLRQTDDNTMPISLVALGKINILSNTKGAQYDEPVNRLSYFAEVIIGRKFTKGLSLQLAPSFIHLNLAPETLKSNDIYALTASGRYKFTKSVAFTAEYTQTLNDYYYKEVASYLPVFSAGFDIETGGHVFQLFFTNAFALNETQYIPFTSTDWGREEFRFGFNISRTFGLGKKKSTSY